MTDALELCFAASRPALALTPPRCTSQQEARGGGLGCGIFKELPTNEISQQRLDGLPQNYVLIQLTTPPAESHAAAAGGDGSCAAEGGGNGEQGRGEPIMVVAQYEDGREEEYGGLLAEFGPAFEPGCDAGCGGSSSSSSSCADSGQSPEPPRPLEWQGRRLEERRGGAAGCAWRAVYVTDGEGGLAQQQQQQQGAGEEEDPYLDEEEAGGAAAAAAAAAAAVPLMPRRMKRRFMRTGRKGTMMWRTAAWTPRPPGACPPPCCAPWKAPPPRRSPSPPAPSSPTRRRSTAA